ncbi:MAG: bifunctional diaminohydroxyphosphoribosylaminopyrimidine deaminase/5-amino-6-(5-phosphoribosylamino)uracil reductase RibD [Phycisphaerae bacterium]
MTGDTKYMQASLKLAAKGIGSVEPNPAVGCVIVKNGQVIGKGYHKEFGGPHAEINALADCKNIGANPKGSTMYVTLEPCCHYGKTWPCTKAIIQAGIAKVVAAILDPSKHADGQGIKQLNQAKIKTQIGVCEDEAKLLNAPFIKFAKTGKSWVILKWAQSIDGKLAWANRDEEHRWISSEKSRADVQQLRGRTQAVITGIRTILADDPLLTIRPDKGKKLIRVVLDNHLRIPLDCQLIKTAQQQPVLIVAYEPSAKSNPQKLQQLTATGTEILTYPDLQGDSNLHFVIDELSKRRIAQILVEGGPLLAGSFLKEKLADEICVYIAPKILGNKGTADINAVFAGLAGHIELHSVNIKSFDSDARINGLTEEGLSVIKSD